DWSSDVCSSDLIVIGRRDHAGLFMFCVSIAPHPRCRNENQEASAPHLDEQFPKYSIWYHSRVFHRRHLCSLMTAARQKVHFSCEAGLFDEPKPKSAPDQVFDKEFHHPIAVDRGVAEV